MTIGIYSIRNIINNKRYIGKSVNIERRLITHKSLLNKPNRNPKQVNRHLYHAVQKYGWNNFETEILQTFDSVDEKLIGESELMWMISFNSIDPDFGYNIRLDTSTGMIVSDETRELSRQNALGEKNPNYGNFWSQDDKSRMSGIKKKHHESGVYGNEWRKKLGKKSKQFWSENPDVKLQMAKNVSAKKQKYDFIQMNNDGSIVRVWSSVDEIIKRNPSWKWQQIYSVCNGHKKRIYGFKWKKVLKDES